MDSASQQPSDPVSIRIALANAWERHAAAIERNRAGMLAREDTEALHRFRVALRKTRALLTLFRDVVPDTESLREEFKWLATATSAARDLDVLLEQAQTRIESAGDNAAAAAPIVDALEHQRADEQERLALAIESPRAQALLASWARFLEQLRVRDDLPPRADVEAWTVLHVLALKRCRSLLRAGISIDADAPAEALHELRIRGKKLRYLLESFELPSKQHRIGTLRKKLRKLQTQLGAHQDSSVAAQQWQQLAFMLDDGRMPATIALLEHWLDAERARQAQARATLEKAIRQLADASEDL